MKKSICSFFLFAALACATPLSVSFVNAGTPAVSDGSAYVGPYTLSINGKNVQAMCVNDYNTTSGSWSANLTTVTSGDLSNTYLGNHSFTVNGTTFTSAQAYTGEAYLFNEILQSNSDRVDIQNAAWTIMDYITGHTPRSSAPAVLNIISDVLNNAGSFNASNFEVLSQVNPGNQPEQEFIVATPEPSTVSLFAGALILAGAVRFRVRRGKQIVSA